MTKHSHCESAAVWTSKHTHKPHAWRATRFKLRRLDQSHTPHTVSLQQGLLYSAKSKPMIELCWLSTFKTSAWFLIRYAVPTSYQESQLISRVRRVLSTLWFILPIPAYKKSSPRRRRQSSLTMNLRPVARVSNTSTECDRSGWCKINTWNLINTWTQMCCRWSVVYAAVPNTDIPIYPY